MNCIIHEVISKVEFIAFEFSPKVLQQSVVNVWIIKFLSVKIQHEGSSPFSFQVVGNELLLITSSIYICSPSSVWTKYALISNCFKKFDLVLQ